MRNVAFEIEQSFEAARSGMVPTTASATVPRRFAAPAAEIVAKPIHHAVSAPSGTVSPLSEMVQQADQARQSDDDKGQNDRGSLPTGLTHRHDTEPLSTRRQPSLTIKELHDRYLDDPGVVRSSKTLLAYRSAYGKFLELVAPQTPIRNIQRDDCRALLQKLRALPTNASKRYRGMTLAEIVREARADDREKMSATTVNAYMNKLSALLNWAVKEGYLDQNPARGLKVVDPIRRKDKRLPFGSEQLKQIFNAPLYRGCLDDEHGYAVPGKAHPRRGRFWVPLIALFSGMRLNEICQINADDVRNVGGVQCFVITTDAANGTDDKRLKTRNAERIVPVHPALIEIGLLDYVQVRTTSHGAKLFPDIRIASTGYYSDNFSKWFAIFAAKTGAKTRRTSFHSFRHCFRDALREGSVAREIAYALGGWSNDSHDAAADTAESYGRGYRPKTLLKAVSAVQYPGLDLSHLIKPEGN